jgi:pimeloyl-ACP methyl ester carboxylesterase
MWSGQRDAVVAAGCRVITPDLRGFGGSPLGTEPPDLDHMADDVITLMDHLEISSATFGGLSMGGYVVMNLLRRHPHRVDAVVLADTKATADPPAGVEGRLAMAALLESSGTGILRERVLPALVGPTTRDHRPDIMATVGRWIDAVPAATAAWAQRAMAARPDSLAVLATFTGPALVLWGDEDTLSTPADHEVMAEALAHAQTVQIAECGHLSAVESSEAVSAAVATFLRNSVPTRD